MTVELTSDRVISIMFRAEGHEDVTEELAAIALEIADNDINDSGEIEELLLTKWPGRLDDIKVRETELVDGGYKCQECGDVLRNEDEFWLHTLACEK